MSFKRHVTYIWGPPRSGKTTLARKLCEGQQITTQHRSWYFTQPNAETVIFDETNRDFDLYWLLDLMGDKPMTVGKTLIKTKNIIIISQMPPSEFLPRHVSPGDIQTFLNRIDKVHSVPLGTKNPPSFFNIFSHPSVPKDVPQTQPNPEAKDRLLRSLERIERKIDTLEERRAKLLKELKQLESSFLV